MIVSSEEITSALADFLQTTEAFVVEVDVLPSFDIHVVIDRNAGVPLSMCEEASHILETYLEANHSEDNYSIEVSSAGIGCVLKVKGQYLKNIDNEVEVTLPNGSHVKGTLKSADDEGFSVDIVEKVKLEGAKKKTDVVRSQYYKYNEVKQVKDIISFK